MGQWLIKLTTLVDGVNSHLRSMDTTKKDGISCWTGHVLDTHHIPQNTLGHIKIGILSMSQCLIYIVSHPHLCKIGKRYDLV